MKTRTLLVMSLIWVVATWPVGADQQSKGALAVKSISPSPESRLGSQPFLNVKLDYLIGDYRSGEQYFVALYCASETPQGWLETAIPYRKKVRKAKGKVRILYSLQDFLADERLAQPLRVKFFLQRRTGALMGEV